MELTVKLTDGRLFTYNSEYIKEIYRINNIDGTITLKLDNCPEINIISEPKLIRTIVYDAYIICILDPKEFISKIKDIITGLMTTFPFMDAYLEPCIHKNITKQNNNELLLDTEYGCQSFLLYLVGEPLDRINSQDHIKLNHYVDTLIGSVSQNLLQGFIRNIKTCFANKEYNLIYDVANIPNNDRILNRTYSAYEHIDMVKKTVNKYNFDFYCM